MPYENYEDLVARNHLLIFHFSISKKSGKIVQRSSDERSLKI